MKTGLIGSTLGIAALTVSAALALTAGAAPSVAPSAIAYTSSNGQTPHLWLMDLGTGARRQLTATRYGEETASWSPDATAIVYAETRRVRVPGLSAPQLTPVIVVRDLARGTTRAITAGESFDETPAWSPGSGRIAFARTAIPTGTSTAYSEIWTIGPGGRAPRRLTHNGVADMAPAWSPGGAALAFQRARRPGSESWDVWVMRADGRGQHRLLRDGTRPAWSPDGRLLAFGQPTGRVSGCCQVTNLMIVDRDGTHRRLLVRNGGRPAWSPDGARIAFQRVSGGHSHVWIVNADGTGLRRLTNSSGDEYAAAWRPR